MSVENVMTLIQDNEVRFVDLRFTDTRGKEQHVGLPISAFEEDHFEQPPLRRLVDCGLEGYPGF